jgi:hypothetical protein
VPLGGRPWASQGQAAGRDLCRGAARSAALRGGPAGRRSQMPRRGRPRVTAGRGRPRPHPIRVSSAAWPERVARTGPRHQIGQAERRSLSNSRCRQLKDPLLPTPPSPRTTRSRSRPDGRGSARTTRWPSRSFPRSRASSSTPGPGRQGQQPGGLSWSTSPGPTPPGCTPHSATAVQPTTKTTATRTTGARTTGA